MYPNHLNSSSPYNQPYKPTLNNNQFSTQQTHNSNTLNLPQSHNFTHLGSYSPTQNHQLGKPKLDRVMYSSTIEGLAPSKNFTFGKLQSMGRFVGNTAQDSKNQGTKFGFQNSHGFGQQKQYSFSNNRQEKNRPVESFQSHSHGNQFDRFPSFNLNDKNNNQQGFSHHHPNQQSQNTEIKTAPVNQTPEEKRRRQILAIKQELEMINKKMENVNLNKKSATQQQKNFDKPHENTKTSDFSNSNNYSNSNNININVNSVGQSSNYQQSNLSTGLSFSKNNQLNVGLQRNKGLATQSMIVTNTQPSSNYKYQSIFDKYDSLKKPTYDTYNENKEDKPSLLDKFVHKGPGLQNLNKQKQFQSNYQKNTFSSSTSSNSTSSSNYDFNPISHSKPIESNFNYQFTQKTTGSSFNNASNQIPTYNISPIQPVKQSPTTGAMFKKKKENPYLEEIKHEYFPTSPKPNIEEPTMFKKNKNLNFEEDIVGNTMKKMNVQESVDFKRQDFVVGKKLGKGQFGEVMLVQHKKTGFLCGMKVMEKKQIRDEKYEGQIARQLSIQFYLAHRNICALYGYFQDQKNVYLLIEYCTGGQLLEMLRKNRRMEEPECSRVIKQIIQGIDYIHKQLIIHRDVKPQNILFNFGVAKICDFGWAVYKGHGMRKTASVGSPLYYSPQIVMGVEYDQKIDIWDIGMMTYECILGKIPFRIYSELDLNRIVQDEIKFPEYIDVTDEAKDFILKIMKKKPEQRMEIREMLRHPFITKYQDQKLPVQIMKDFKDVLSG